MERIVENSTKIYVLVVGFVNTYTSTVQFGARLSSAGRLDEGEIMMKKDGFEPKIIGFLCNWCAYAGADLAGVSRIQYPSNIRIIRVMCSGRIEPAFILEAFKDGSDGVLVAGCHLPSDCHYINGNLKAERRITLLRKVLADLGIEQSRLRLEWVSASEGEKFAAVVRDMVEDIKKIGPNPLKKKEIAA